MTDEGLAISTNEGLSKLYIVYKLKEISLRINRFYKTDVCFHRLRSPHPSEIAEGIFSTPFPLNGKAHISAIPLAVSIFKLPDKSKFEIQTKVDKIVLTKQRESGIMKKREKDIRL